MPQAAQMAQRTVRTIRAWIKKGHLTRYEGPSGNRGSAPVLVSVSELRAHLNTIGETPAANNATPQPAPPSDPEEAGPEEEQTLADQLRADLGVAQKAMRAIEKRLDKGEEIPGRTIAALGTLIRTVSALKEKISTLEAQRPRGPRTEEEARRTLRLALEGWEDQALEMAFEVYRERHTEPMQGRVCRLTVDDGQGHQSVWTEAGWLAVAS